MKRPRPSARVIGKYALFQIPGLLLLAAALAIFDHWLDVPVWIWFAVLGGWAVKDVIIFPFVWRSFDDTYRGHDYSPVGLTGQALELLEPAGKVKVRGERWRAELAEGAPPIPAGAPVRVVAARGLVVLVEPAEE